MNASIAKTLHNVTGAARFKIIELLFDSPYCVTALAGKLGMSIAKTSTNLAILRKDNIIIGTKVGRTIYYQINKAVLVGLLRNFLLQAKTYREPDIYTYIPLSKTTALRGKKRADALQKETGEIGHVPF